MGIGSILPSILVSRDSPIDSEAKAIKETEDWCKDQLKKTPTAYLKYKQKLDALIVICHLKVQEFAAQGMSSDIIHKKLVEMRALVCDTMNNLITGENVEIERKMQVMRTKLEILQLNPLEKPSEKRALFTKKGGDHGMSSSSTSMVRLKSGEEVTEEVYHAVQMNLSDVVENAGGLYELIKHVEGDVARVNPYGDSKQFLIDQGVLNQDGSMHESVKQIARDYLEEKAQSGIRELHIVRDPDSHKDVATTAPTAAAEARPSEVLVGRVDLRDVPGGNGCYDFIDIVGGPRGIEQVVRECPF